MEEANDFVCSECNKNFEDSASSLLQHYAVHAGLELIKPKESVNRKKMNIPDLYPISVLKDAQRESYKSDEKDVDSGYEDLINPLSLCVVSIAEDKPNESTSMVTKKTKKFQCTYCFRGFGWSTDLKRHILTHTGQRPFECDSCDATFTRKVALIKHKTKQHDKSKALQIPALKPIDSIFKHKGRKQDKRNIKKRFCNTPKSDIFIKGKVIRNN